MTETSTATVIPIVQERWDATTRVTGDYLADCAELAREALSRVGFTQFEESPYADVIACREGDLPVTVMAIPAEGFDMTIADVQEPCDDVRTHGAALCVGFVQVRRCENTRPGPRHGGGQAPPPPIPHAKAPLMLVGTGCHTSTGRTSHSTMMKNSLLRATQRPPFMSKHCTQWRPEYAVLSWRPPPSRFESSNSPLGHPAAYASSPVLTTSHFAVSDWSPFERRAQ